MAESTGGPKRTNGQSILTEAELDKEMPPRVLMACNPRDVANIARYSYKDKLYHVEDIIRPLVIHLSVIGTLVHKNTATGAPPATPAAQSVNGHNVSEGIAADSGVGDNEATVNALRNQFYFNDRSTQTFSAIIRQRGIATSPPPSCDYNVAVTQCVIFDKYVEAIESSKTSGGDSGSQALETEGKKSKPDPVYSEKMKLSAKIMERILNLNLDNEAYQDFKFYIDKSDAFKTNGSLLPLWRFTNEKTKRRQVTCVKWNPGYADLFAVSFGSYEFLKQQAGGSVAIYSLKNIQYPELLIATDATVCCLDWNLAKPALLAVGLYDGTVAVLDVRNRGKKFIYQSTVKDSKHTDPVWEIRWDEPLELPSATLGFTSISVDGRLCSWKLKKSKLECEVISELKLNSTATEQPPTALTGLGNGLCFDFSPHDKDLYLVGTEEGLIHKCSRFFPNQAEMTYKGHSMAVYGVKWNPFHPGVFVSGSADWTVKVWSGTRSSPLCSFDLGQAVGDIDWSPVSSSVFGAVNADGNLFVYDLEVNRYKEATCQKVAVKGKLTKVTFNAVEPVILVGDDRGGVSCLKLSPNLRKGSGVAEKETEKMSKIIDILSD